MPFDPATEIQNFLVFGEYGDVNPSICDSSTYTFLTANKMDELFEHEIEGCFLYSRHWTPTNRSLSTALARMEAGESALVTSSGMAAISSTLMQLCSQGDEIISSQTIYGGTYALLANFLPRFGIKTHFVNMQDFGEIEAKIGPKTRVIYCESVANPLLDVADIPRLSTLAQKHRVKLVIDNTFSPLIFSPLRLGADVVIHSLTKFINGTSDCVAGCIVSTNQFIAQLNDINSGPNMLLGPVLDSFRSAGLLKNLHSLHLRMVKHSQNALFLAEKFAEFGLKVTYPGLKNHAQHALFKNLMNPGYGFGGIVTVDLKNKSRAGKFMVRMQEEKVGYLAVSLGYFKTLFSAPGHSTSSEIPREEREKMGMGDGLIRFSVGLDNDMELTWEKIKICLNEV